MKRIILAIISIAFLINNNTYGQCDDMIYELDNCISNADDGYSYLRKAFKEVDYVEYSDSYSDLIVALETAQTLCKKGKGSSEDAQLNASNVNYYASDCGCDDGESYCSSAESNADDAYTYSKKAYRYIDDALYTDNLEDMQYYIDDILRYLKKAYNAIEDAKNEAESAKYECE